MAKELIWIVVGMGGLALLMGDGGDIAVAPPESVPQTVTSVGAATPPNTAPAAGNGLAEVALIRAPDGHFYADAQVNGATIRFLVDTGATRVALTPADAQRAGLQFSSGEFTARGETAGGPIALKPVTLDRVAIGAVEARQVDAVIAEDKLGVSLLGQSWLGRVRSVTIADDRMVLR